MPNSAINCFKNSSNDFKTSNDYINRKKAKTIYNSTKNNNLTTKKNGSEYKGPVFVNGGHFLGSVGGYNIKNYDLLLNVAKGRAYSEAQCITNLEPPDNVIPNLNETCINPRSKCAPINSTYNLFEGPFLINKTSDNLNCEPTIIKNSTTYTLRTDVSNSQSLKKLANRDKLQNLNLNTKIPIHCYR